MITNEHAQVLDEQDRVIDGLYATGNITATVMGRTYPGAGASIANTMVFGYVAARHAAARVAGERAASRRSPSVNRLHVCAERPSRRGRRNRVASCLTA